MLVIPAINCHYGDTSCAREKLRIADEFLKKDDFVHLDVADGIFTFNKTWGDPTGWANLRVKFNLEVHLMVEGPEKHIEPWLAAEAKRFIVHIEAITPESFREILNLVGSKAEVMLASNPETPAEEMAQYSDLTSMFQVLAVNPGLAGQKFLPSALEKIKFLRKKLPDAKIEVDGGINLETGKLVASAGADVLVAASYIFASDNPKKAYATLKSI